MKLNHVSRKYFGIKCGGQHQDEPDVVVLHSTEGDTAEGAAAYLHTRPDGSVHICVDDNSAYVLAHDRTTVCGCGWNNKTYQIEQAGHSGWSKTQWLRRIKTMRRAAYWAAKKMRQHNIKPRYLSASDLRSGQRNGYTYHVDVTNSGVGQTTHTDPGPHYPKKVMHRLILHYYRRGK